MYIIVSPKSGVTLIQKNERRLGHRECVYSEHGICPKAFGERQAVSIDSF